MRQYYGNFDFNQSQESRFDAVILLVERSAKVKIFIAPASNERTLNGLSLLVQWSNSTKKRGFEIAYFNRI